MTVPTLRVTATGAISHRAVLEQLADATPLVVLTTRFWLNLAHEMGSEDHALPFLVELAERRQAPIGLNLEFDADHCRTVFFRPRSWSQEKTLGWVAARREELEGEFGTIEQLTTDDGVEQ
jgi:hypothetical protein